MNIQERKEAERIQCMNYTEKETLKGSAARDLREKSEMHNEEGGAKMAA